jgi:uncharacterized protein
VASLLDKIKTLPRFLVWLLFQIYRLIISPALHLITGAGSGCRFHPTCSKYAQAAIVRHGYLKGGLMGFWRILRCNPFSHGGHDPVPGSFDNTNRAMTGPKG